MYLCSGIAVPVAADWRNAKAVGDLQSLQLLNNVLGVQRP